MILVPLKKFCSTTTDVISLVEKMFNDIKAHKDLKDFRVYKEMKKGLGHALADAIILEPNFGGIGFSFSKMINYFRKNKFFKCLLEKQLDTFRLLFLWTSADK